MEHLFVGEYFAMGLEVNSLLGHTVYASKIASVGNGETQVIDPPIFFIYIGFRFHGFIDNN